MEEREMPKAHKLVVNNRKTSMVTGVLDVLSFDLNEILLETEQGMLMVKGTDLHVNRLSVEKGEVDLSGNIDSIAYSSVNQAGRQNENFFAKLLSRHAYDAGNRKRSDYIFLRGAVRDSDTFQLPDTQADEAPHTSPYRGCKSGRSVVLARSERVSVPTDVYDNIW